MEPDSVVFDALITLNLDGGNNWAGRLRVRVRDPEQ